MTRYTNPVPQIEDDDGKPIVGAKKYFFETGTSTLKTVYSDAALSLPIDNPVLSDSGGRFPSIFIDGIYREVQHDDKGVQLWDEDPIGEPPTGQARLWSVSQTYNIPEIVYGSDDEYYRSLTDTNIGNNPTTSPAAWELVKFTQVWNTNVTYVLGQTVIASDNLLYFSRLASNFGNDPTTNPDDWGTVSGNVPIVTAGTATVYTAIFGITAYETNRVYEARIHTDNTGPATINFDSLGPKDIKTLAGNDSVAGQLTGIISLWYDGANMVLLDSRIDIAGTWTPTLQDSSFSDGEGQTYVQNEGNYLKIGSMVFFDGFLRLSSLGTLTAGDSAFIAGLPDSSVGNSGGMSVSSGTSLSISAGSSVTGTVTGSGNIALQLWDDTGGVTSMLISEVTSSGWLRFQGQYNIV